MSRSFKSFILLYFLISLLLVGSVFAIFKSAQFFYGTDYEIRMQEQFLMKNSMDAKLLEKEIYSLINYSDEEEIIKDSNTEIKESFISESIKIAGKSKQSKRYYANDLLSTEKLVESDKLDMIKDKIIERVPRKPYFTKFKTEIEKFEAKIIMPVERDILVQNFSPLIKKPAIAITYTNKNRTQQITKIFLSDFLNNNLHTSSLEKVFITDFLGNLLFDSNGSKLILGESVKEKEIFQRVNKSSITRTMQSIEQEDGKYYVASVKFNDFGIILFRTTRIDLYLKEVSAINERLTILLIIIICISETLLFIILKLTFRKSAQ